MSKSRIEAYSLNNQDGAALVWGGFPATEVQVQEWAHTLIVAANAGDPLSILKSGPKILHSGIVYSYENSTLYFVSGRVGLFSIYLLETNRALWFANYPGLFAGRVKIDIDETGLAQLLLFGQCFEKTTVSRGMMILEPAEVVRYSNDRKLEWLGRFVPPVREHRSLKTYSAPDVVERLKSTVIGCVQPESTMLQISGGLDSRLLLAAVKEQEIALMTFGEHASTDVQLASQLAQTSGKSWVHFDTMLPESSLDGWANLVALAGGGEKPLDHGHTAIPYETYPQWPGWVLINGNGGEFVRCYWYDLGKATWGFGLPMANGLSNTFVQRYLERRISGREGPSIYNLLRPEVRSMIPFSPSDALRRTLEPFEAFQPVADLLDDYYLDVRCHRFVVLGNQLGGLFFVRGHPFYSPQLLEKLACLPLAQRVNSRFHRTAIASLAPEFMSIAWGKTGRPLDHGARPLYWLPKRWLPRWMRPTYQSVPYINYSRLFRTKWRSWIGDTVASLTPVLDPWVPSERFIRLLDDHLAGIHDHTRALGVLISFGLWVKLTTKGNTQPGLSIREIAIR